MNAITDFATEKLISAATELEDALRAPGAADCCGYAQNVDLLRELRAELAARTVTPAAHADYASFTKGMLVAIAAAQGKGAPGKLARRTRVELLEIASAPVPVSEVSEVRDDAQRAAAVERVARLFA